MNKLRVVTWNAEGMFDEHVGTIRANDHDGIAVIKELDADIVVIPEFGEQGAMPEHVRVTMNYLGYEIATVPYDPDPGYYHTKDQHYPYELAIFTRLTLLSSAALRLGGVRNALDVTCRDVAGKKLRIIGVHLDDNSEAMRLKQAEDLVVAIGKMACPTLVMGDFNAMRSQSQSARFARNRLLHSVVRRAPHTLIRSIASRAHEMASGTTIDYILRHGQVHDLDPGHHLTISGKQHGVEWMPSIRLAKVDWIFGSHHFKTESYKVWRDVGSDHRPVRAELEY